MIRVSPGQVNDEIGACQIESGIQTFGEANEICLIATTIGEFNIEVTPFLVKREVAGAVDGESEDAVITRQNARRAIALMHIAIDDQHALGAVLRLHGAGGDGGIVEDAKTFTAIAKGVVGATRQVGRDAIGKSGTAGTDGGPG